ncbi:MAG: hypothetical protein F7B18_02505 [Desulfurococcales archaeon]|nr:hypothetical protein [Desulfurococcales archaeon]
MDEAVVAIILIAFSLAASVALHYQLQGAEALVPRDSVVLVHVAPLNQTHGVYYVESGCLDAFNLSLAPGLYCRGDLVVLSDAEAARYTP